MRFTLRLMVAGFVSSSFFATDTTFENGGPLSQRSPQRFTGRTTAPRF
jgi:hypothetical protein